MKFTMVSFKIPNGRINCVLMRHINGEEPYYQKRIQKFTFPNNPFSNNRDRCVTDCLVCFQTPRFTRQAGRKESAENIGPVSGCFVAVMEWIYGRSPSGALLEPYE